MKDHLSQEERRQLGGRRVPGDVVRQGREAVKAWMTSNPVEVLDG